MDKAGAKGDLIELFFSFCHYSDLIRVFLADNEVRVAASVNALQAFANVLPDDSKRRFILNLQMEFDRNLVKWMNTTAVDDAVSQDILDNALAAVPFLKDVTLSQLQKILRKAGLFVAPIEDMTVTANAEEGSGPSDLSSQTEHYINPNNRPLADNSIQDQEHGFEKTQSGGSDGDSSGRYQKDSSGCQGSDGDSSGRYQKDSSGCQGSDGDSSGWYQKDNSSGCEIFCKSSANCGTMPKREM